VHQGRQAVEPVADLALGQLTEGTRGGAEKGPAAETAIERRHGNVAPLRQPGGRLGERPIHLAMLGQPGVESGGQPLGGGDAHLFGHGHHCRHAQFAHQPLRQPA
jgi:hypothetical protein